MNATYIEYRDTGSFSSTLLRYLDNDPEIRELYEHPPTLEGFGSLLEKKHASADRSLLVKVLSTQYNNAQVDDSKVRNNILLLAEPNTYTVTTGHQLNIFTGPLYFLYKIITAIKTAELLKAAHPDKNFVPVYWMATEDHDFDEINHINLPDKKIVWDAHSSGGATGRLSTSSLISALKEYTGYLGLTRNGMKLSQLINRAYKGSSTLAEATLYLVNELFADYGLVVIDADNAELKASFSRIIQHDILTKTSFSQLQEAEEVFKAKGLKAQAHGREINFFYLLDGKRERIVEDNNTYKVFNTHLKFSRDELSKEIDTYPERFSPNVITRPLYQEFVLPNIAYVGGGSEIVYWLQIKEVFRHYNIDFPILILRNSALIATKPLSAKLKSMKLGYVDLFRPADEIKRQWVLKNCSESLDISEEKEKFNEIFDIVKLKAGNIDLTLIPSARAISIRLQKAIQGLETKMIKAEKRKHQESMGKIDSLLSAYFPQTSLQERFFNFGYLYIKYGDGLIEGLYDHFKPLDFKFTILEPSHEDLPD